MDGFKSYKFWSICTNQLVLGLLIFSIFPLQTMNEVRPTKRGCRPYLFHSC